MLEWLKLFISGKERNVYIYITVKDGLVTVAKSDILQLDPTTVVKLDEEDSKQWLRNLEKLHVNRWRTIYEEELITDVDNSNTDKEAPVDELWKLDYKALEKRCRHLKGKNSYPVNWDSFLTLVEEITPECYNRQIRSINVKIHRNLFEDLLPMSNKWMYVEELSIHVVDSKV